MNTENPLYYGRDIEAVSERDGNDNGNGNDAVARITPALTSFTAVNQQSHQRSPPQSSTTREQKQATRTATRNTRRHHNPAVAQYLGIGTTSEPTHLEKYAPLPAVPGIPHPKHLRKRRRLADDNTTSGTRTNASEKDGPNQRRVSDSFRVAKPAAPQIEHLVHVEKPSIEFASYEMDGPGHVERGLPQRYNTMSISEDDDFGFDFDDDDLLMLTSEVDGPSGNTNHTSSSPAKSSNKDDNAQHHVPHSCANASILVETPTTTHSSQRSSKQFVSPVTLTTRLLAATGNVGSAQARKPIVRPPFPAAVRNRSPVIGLSSNSLLRTCFRIGEAINQGYQASKSGKHLIIELYARVLASERTDTGQYFTFCDLFHAKAPYLKGTYKAAIWKSVHLFEYDSRRLLKQGRMCRCMGTLKRDGKEWKMEVLNIWEATWEDIEWVEGIVRF
ncbi:hypothetical protein BDW02DRAFT_574123 [Decorospora gaudefroyi]|uniref:Uncharacterized protein n=1 Tax=Decorospora gaudefroyi TaxID=184978 RepID=A0A6A5JX20_9PLEO|nr:hypothetical protein BDW02DRAFT_574123 [Decorospora gaudefroyi]